MPLSAGDSLGPYEVLAPIGAGGMGEVYRARDKRLGRDVAIKVSREDFNDRFEREARSIASLNHPNICQLYDVGPNYLVMELIEGDTLCGPLPAEDAIKIAGQIADALEAAHERGIVHRDLKPANIKITPGGVVKVLDFGLAKTRETPASDSAHSPTMSMSATRAGMILGTAAYMSPEQARGKPVDKRADIWAFGCIVFEMLTGRQAFRGETTTDILAALIKEQPNFEAIPAHLRFAIEKCLRKDPRVRWRDIGDARNALEEAAIETKAVSSAPLPIAPLPSSARLSWAVAGAFVLITVVLAWVHFGARPPADRPLMRLSVDLGYNAVAGPRTTAVISPDASRLAFAVRESNGKQLLATRRFDQENPIVLAGTENAMDPFFSPDSQWIGFIAEGKMKKVSVQGGAPLTLCDAGDARGASWGEDGNIIFTDRNTSVGLSRLPETGGVPQTLTTPAPGEYSNRWPQILPGGQSVLFTSAATAGDWENGSIQMLSLKTGKRKILQHKAYFGRYLPTSDGVGHLVYLHQGTMFAAPFDPRRGEMQGTPVPMLENRMGGSFGSGNFSFSRSGVFVYSTGAGSQGLPLVLLDNGGKPQPLAFPAAISTARFSPDGKRIALASGISLYIYDRERDRMTLLAQPLVASSPVWTPDGKYIVFRTVTSSASGFVLKWIRADGGGAAQTLIEKEAIAAPSSFSPDGKNLAFIEAGRGVVDVWALPLNISDPENPRPGQPQRIVPTAVIGSSPSFSPDGKWIAYSSLESGRIEVYVRPFPPPMDGSRTQISDNGGQHPAWSRTANEIFFDTPNGEILVARYKINGQSFVTEKPHPWSNTPIMPSAGVDWGFDLAPDGRHVIALVSPGVAGGHQSSVHVEVLLNFFDEVRRRVPVNR